MSGRPAISVIMNCLNGERHLPAALESVAAQTLQDYEIIFYDNASSDASGRLARAFGPRLRYFRGEHTVPLGQARNLALAQATGDLVAFLDCDDLWLPEKLACQAVLFAKNPRLGLACTDTRIMDGARLGGTLFAGASPARGMAFERLVRDQWISMSSAMLRREALEAAALAPGAYFDETLHVCEEADLFYRVAHDWELDFVPEPLTLWRVHGGNSTIRQFGQFARETRQILARLRGLYPDFATAHADLSALLESRAAFQEAVQLWSSGQGARARAVLEPWRDSSPRHRLFWWASHLPGGCFGLAARLYFALPPALRKPGARRAQA